MEHVHERNTPPLSCADGAAVVGERRRGAVAAADRQCADTASQSEQLACRTGAGRSSGIAGAKGLAVFSRSESLRHQSGGQPAAQRFSLRPSPTALSAIIPANCAGARSGDHEPQLIYGRSSESRAGRRIPPDSRQVSELMGRRAVIFRGIVTFSDSISPDTVRLNRRRGRDDFPGVSPWRTKVPIFPGCS